MHSNEHADRRTGSLSTEDLAQPPDTGAGRETEAASQGAPVYPGEGIATGRPGGESATGRTEAEAGAQETSATAAAPGVSDDEMPQLLSDEEERDYRDRWQEIQGRFVDDPREAVHDADMLVADVMRTLAATFAERKKDLEGQWSVGEEVDTEQLRGALRRYRSFFNRLLGT
ncbi:hypothetical protein [Streptomyces sp. NK08204]|uniref:hypothetical protein n=1 Tax=Streptomyces sp. NK08204 TaxID=2873260 RepID=UPI001CEDC68C|nr:hypothetical protein [Streptomyces sp. NK08204]